MHALVVGSGIVGLATAWRLARAGLRVTVLDASAGPGQGASWANGGQLSYSYVAPLAGPSVWRDLPRLLFGRDPPVRVRPRLDPDQIGWIVRFLGACTRGRALAATDRLLALSALSRRVLDGAPEVRAIPADWSRAGKLVVYGWEADLAAARRGAALAEAHGHPQRILDREGCLGCEPALAGIAGRIRGGAFSPGDEAVDPRRLCLGLHDLLRAPPFDVAFRFGLPARRLLRVGSRIVGVGTDDGVLEADHYVLAAGLGSRALAAGAGLPLPLHAVKGYSLTAPIAVDEAAPRVSVTDFANRVVYARLGGFLRVAGMADIVGAGGVDPARAAQLVRQAREAFPSAASWRSVDPWAGLRPATPTGLPIVGASGLDNLALNVGHGAYGLTLAFGSAEIVACAIPDLVPRDRAA